MLYLKLYLLIGSFLTCALLTAFNFVLKNRYEKMNSHKKARLDAFSSLIKDAPYAYTAIYCLFWPAVLMAMVAVAYERMRRGK
jgi:hypothetical protein